MSTAVSTQEIGAQLVALCSQGQNLEAINTLYADHAVSVEAMDCPEEGFHRVTEGIDAIRAKNEFWFEHNEVHSGECIGPFPNDDRFAVFFRYDATCKKTNQRYQMDEVGLYTVADGKIVREEFFYAMPEE